MKNEMGGACELYGEGRGQGHTGFWWENLTERDHLEDTSRWEHNIKMDLNKSVVRTWTGMTQDLDRWWAIVNAVMNFRVS
jgi:hypothetical protein